MTNLGEVLLLYAGLDDQARAKVMAALRLLVTESQAEMQPVPVFAGKSQIGTRTGTVDNYPDKYHAISTR